MAPIPRQPVADTLAIDLDRLLNRLEKALLSPESDQSLRTSSYERNRVGANVEYARTLLLRLEHASTNIKTQSRKVSAQSDLQSKRDLIKRLNQRLLDLNQLDDNDDDSTSESDDDDGAEYGSTAPREFAPAVPTSSGIDTQPPDDLAPPGLRARKPPPQAAAAAQPSTATTSSALFGSRGPADTAQTTQAVLDESRRQQDALTGSLVGLAQALKQSSVSFAASLEGEKGVLGRAEQGLDRNALGMEAAGRRMGALRRMTEGQGWWGRIKLYGIIAALWVAAFLMVFVGPKLRF
ncbi:hypothetical protein MBLNU459_g4145t1 [Dothideomycetes sp. NU459]